MKTLEVIHWIVEVVVLAIIAGAVFAVVAVDFRAIGGSQATMLTIAQIVVCFTCIPGGYMVKKGINRIFTAISRIIKKEA
jgi:hypothetical protein